MRKGQIGLGLLAVCLMLGAGCRAGEAEPDVMEIISSAPAVKLEYAEQPDEAIVINNGTLLLQISDLAISPASKEVFDEAWIYRFTYNPPEAVPSGQVVEVLFGPEHMSVNGVVYLPREGTPYSGILEWAEFKFEYYSEQDEERAESTAAETAVS